MGHAPPCSQDLRPGGVQGGRVTEDPESARRGPFLPAPTRSLGHICADHPGLLPWLASPWKPLISVLPLDLTPGLPISVEESGIQTQDAQHPATHCGVLSGPTGLSRISARWAGAAPGHFLARALSCTVSLSLLRSPGYSLGTVTAGPQSYRDREAPSCWRELNTAAGAGATSSSCSLLSPCCLRPRKATAKTPSKLPSGGASSVGREHSSGAGGHV